MGAIMESAPQDRLLNQYNLSLRANFKRLVRKGLLAEETIEQIESLVAMPSDWETAYQAEQELASAMDEDIIDVELNRCLEEYKHRFDDDSFQHYRDEYARQCGGPHERSDVRRTTQKRTLLLQLTKHLQWYFTKRTEARALMAVTRLRTSLVFLGAFACFVGSLIAYVYLDGMALASRALIVTSFAGALGASFSMLTGLGAIMDSSLGDLRVIHRFNHLLIRCFIGVCAALIFYFFVQSQILSVKGAFPSLPVEDIHAGVEGTYANMSALIVWSFIAGFSEKLVPALLDKTSRKLTE